MPNSKPYCLMPWIHYHVGDGGVAKACCVANIPFGNVNKDSFIEIWNGKSIETLRDKFKKGESDKRCAQCIHIEAAGGKSIRQETFEKYPDVEIDLDIDNNYTDKPFPFYFDIRFSNVCNFRCRTCWHGASSKWFQDAKLLGRNMGEKAIIKNIENFDAFIKEMGPALKGAKEIYLAGGEPLVTKEHYQLLEWLLEQGNREVLLRYNTNFSKLSFKQYNVLELWKQFPNVEVMASVDGSGAIGEYIRTDMVWDEILANREKIKSCAHVKFKVAPTVSVFNIMHLPELYKELVNSEFIQPKDIYINILERPAYFNIQIFSGEKKETIRKVYGEFFTWLREKGISDTVRQSFEDCLNYMEAKDQSKQWRKFETEVSNLDKLRSESLYEIVPELEKR